MKRFLLFLFVIALGIAGYLYFSKNDPSGANALKEENALLKRENELLKREQTLQRQKDSLAELEQKRKDSLEMLKTNVGSLDFLMAYGGKYPYEVAMMENSVLNHRLRTMLGKELDYLKSVWDIQAPIEIRDGYFYTWAIKEKSAGKEGAAIMVDLNKDKMYVGIRKNDQAQIYTEDGSTPPTRLSDWAKGE